MNNSRYERLSGISVSLPTFTDQEYNLELGKAQKQIRWLIDQGLTEENCVVFTAGGLGEGYFLDDDEWVAMAETLVEAAAGKVPTGIGVFELSARRAAKKAKIAADIGMEFIQCAPPRYMQPTEDEIFTHYQYISDNADIGIMAYNTPWAMPGGYNFSRSLIERFTQIDNFAGIKWSTTRADDYISMIRHFGDRISFVSNGGVMSIGYQMGARGFTDFMVNVAPRLSLLRWQLVKEQRWTEFDELEVSMRYDPAFAVEPGDMSAPGMGEGPDARLRLSVLGMETGPHFPAQVGYPQSHIDAYKKTVDASGIRDWVDWDQSILD
ncbi:MAG: dihydrodipicolinate synthase family protein [SAR202 cluster bacterium]|nr:dihydrodipicolinate synthase family protein [SAR202 cluster bacterium]